MASILIVDDNLNNLSVLISLLEPLGFEIDLAENGQEAIHRIEKNLPDLILLDLVMPVMDGFEFLEALRERELDDIPVVVATARAAPSSALPTASTSSPTTARSGTCNGTAC